MEFSELWDEIKKFAEGKSSLDVVKEFFTIFWDSTHMSEEVSKDNIAKAESLHIALEALEVGYFSKKNFLAFLRSHS